MTDTTDKGWFSEEIATFGDRVAGAREAAGMTQEELSRRLGVKLKTVQGWEDDLLEPRANKLQMMAGMLNVSIVWLLTGEGDGPDGPVEAPKVNGQARAMLSDLARLRAQALAMAHDMGQVEKKLRVMLREGVE